MSSSNDEELPPSSSPIASVASSSEPHKSPLVTPAAVAPDEIALLRQTSGEESATGYDEQEEVVARDMLARLDTMPFGMNSSELHFVLALAVAFRIMWAD
jgi:hypothetical protein